jgi:hypothetical protein
VFSVIDGFLFHDAATVSPLRRYSDSAVTRDSEAAKAAFSVPPRRPTRFT